jgi:hypothetical protein
VTPLPALALVAAVAAASPVLAEDCPSAQALEQRLLETPVEPFVAKMDPARPDQAWRVGSGGGFWMAAPPLGEVLTLRHATATTSCGLKISWRASWGGGGGRVTSADQFKVVQTEDKPAPRASQKYGATLFRITPDKASQTAWLSMTYGGRTSDYLLNFPATAITVGPISPHSGGAWLEVIGVRADGAVVYAEFTGMEPR